MVICTLGSRFHKRYVQETENPHEFVGEELNTPGVNVWAEIQSDGIVGPYFLMVMLLEIIIFKCRQMLSFLKLKTVPVTMT
jgi:hypothetical protein